jgi:hypothetical protein
MGCKDFLRMERIEDLLVHLVNGWLRKRIAELMPLNWGFQ